MSEEAVVYYEIQEDFEDENITYSVVKIIESKKDFIEEVVAVEFATVDDAVRWVESRALPLGKPSE